MKAIFFIFLLLNLSSSLANISECTYRVKDIDTTKRVTYKDFKIDGESLTLQGALAEKGYHYNEKSSNVLILKNSESYIELYSTFIANSELIGGYSHLEQYEVVVTDDNYIIVDSSSLDTSNPLVIFIKSHKVITEGSERGSEDSSVMFIENNCGSKRGNRNS